VQYRSKAMLDLASGIVGGQRAPVEPTARQQLELDRLQRAIAAGEIAPASVRLAEQLREMFAKWAERGIA
jgi:hypothetical protein